jgi:hypothetical protein
MAQEPSNKIISNTANHHDHDHYWLGPLREAETYPSGWVETNNNKQAATSGGRRQRRRRSRTCTLSSPIMTASGTKNRRRTMSSDYSYWLGRLNQVEANAECSSSGL